MFGSQIYFFFRQIWFLVAADGGEAWLCFRSRVVRRLVILVSLLGSRCFGGRSEEGSGGCCCRFLSRGVLERELSPSSLKVTLEIPLLGGTCSSQFLLCGGDCALISACGGS